MSTIITKITFNWFYTTDTRDGGECFEAFVLGKNGVTKIFERASEWEGDKTRYIVELEDGSSVTIFNPNIVYKKEV